MENQQPKKPAAILNTLWIIFLGSTFSFLAILVLTVKGPPLVSANSNLGYILMGVAIFMAVLSFQIPKFLRLQVKQKNKIKQLTQEEISQLDFAPTIISFVLSESVGIFGLVIGMFTGSIESGLSLCLASTVLMAIHKPKNRF